MGTPILANIHMGNDTKMMINHGNKGYLYAQTPRVAHTPSMLYTWGYQTLDFTFNWEDQQGRLENINFPPPLNFYIH